jgi:two-component system NtrC family sensor kinase
VLAHHPLGIALIDLQSTTALSLALWLLAFAAILSLSVYFVSHVLAQLVDREKQLVRMDRQLSQSEKLASVGNLAAGVAHEINNPVAVIQNKVQILRYRIADQEPEQVLCEDLDTVEKHVGRIRSITDGLLTFSRETPFALAALDLDAVVKEGADLVAVPFRNARVELRTSLHARGSRVRGSQNHLLQVLVNMMLNAVDAAPAGSCVTVDTSVEPGGHAVIRIEDHGEGIEPEHLSKIFDPFFTTKDVGRGTGLGLAISHGIVERHGGRIEVESERGVGSTFTIRLPLAT